MFDARVSLALDLCGFVLSLFSVLQTTPDSSTLRAATRKHTRSERMGVSKQKSLACLNMEALQLDLT